MSVQGQVIVLIENWFSRQFDDRCILCDRWFTSWWVVGNFKEIARYSWMRWAELMGWWMVG